MKNAGKVILSIIVIAGLFVFNFGCDSKTTVNENPFDPSTELLADNEINGWTEKVTATRVDGVEVYTPANVGAYNNGEGDSYSQLGMVAGYIDLFGSGTLEVKIECWDMANETNSKAAYDEDYIGILDIAETVALTIGDESHMLDNGVSWTVKFRKGKWYCVLTSGGSDPSDAGHETPMKSMATALINKM